MSNTHLQILEQFICQYKNSILLANENKDGRIECLPNENHIFDLHTKFNNVT